MANLSDRVPENSSGKYYVDTSCIDCDQCRTQGPEFFGRNEDGFSYVLRQPVTSDEVQLLNEIAAACAVNSIGDDGA